MPDTQIMNNLQILCSQFLKPTPNQAFGEIANLAKLHFASINMNPPSQNVNKFPANRINSLMPQTLAKTGLERLVHNLFKIYLKNFKKVVDKIQ
jgi:hypothetical protein